MTSEEAIEFVNNHGIVLESAHGPVPNIAEVIAEEKIRGNWWGHPKAHTIFDVTRRIRDSGDILVCRLINGKITYVHKRLWPALVRLSEQFPRDQLVAVREIHTSSGKHRVEEIPFPLWVPSGVAERAKKLTKRKATMALREWIENGFGTD